jgi:hypothetical protein
MAEPKQTTLPEGYEEVDSANFVKFEKFGDTVAGKLIDKGMSEQYKFGLYTVLNEDGEQLRFHGSAQLDDLLLTCVIGDNIMVEFIDKEKTPKGEMKLFRVLRKKGE